jgi:aldehyde dehydrogenase (NAD+)
MQDLPARFAALRERSRTLALSTAAERADRLRRLNSAVLANRKRFYEAAWQELRACDLDVAAQLVMIKSETDFAVKNVARWMRPRRVRNSAATLGKKCYVLHEPKGVVLNLSTWNAPVCIGIVPAIAAIAAGNAFALKPSELAPASAAVLREVVEAEFPPEEFAVFEGGRRSRRSLLALPFDHVYYTGGQRVGRLVMKAAAEHFAGVTLEMGGKNPAIVDASAGCGKRRAQDRVGSCGQRRAGVRRARLRAGARVAARRVRRRARCRRCARCTTPRVVASTSRRSCCGSSTMRISPRAGACSTMRGRRVRAWRWAARRARRIATWRRPC